MTMIYNTFFSTYEQYYCTDTKYREVSFCMVEQNGKSVYIELVKSFSIVKISYLKPLNELEGRFDKESLIDKSLMASHEMDNLIQEKIVMTSKVIYL